MVAIGSAVGELQQGQQLAGIVNLIFMLPILLSAVLIQDPAGPLAVFLTLFPTSSFLTVALRWGLGTIPVWQMVVGWVLLVATTLLMFWVAARIFRAGMLRYGQPLSLKSALSAISPLRRKGIPTGDNQPANHLASNQTRSGCHTPSALVLVPHSADADPACGAPGLLSPSRTPDLGRHRL